MPKASFSGCNQQPIGRGQLQPIGLEHLGPAKVQGESGHRLGQCLDADIFAIGKLAWFLVALVAGTVVGALAVIAAKQLTGVRPAVTPSAESAVPA